MTVPVQDAQTQDPRVDDKEKNFRNLEAKYKRELEQERNARLEAERQAQEALSRKAHDDDEDDDEPYVDRKKLDKKLAKFGEQNKQDTRSEIQKAVQQAIQQERRDNWLKSNPDFQEIFTEDNLNKFATHDPELAESIMAMPDGFEKQKLVYRNIKALGLHKPPVKQSTIQEKIDANRRSPYYQNPSVGTAPYSTQSDFSPQGQKQAYEKMQALKSSLRL